MINLFEKTWFSRLALHITIAGAIMVLYISYLILWPAHPLKVAQPYRILTPVVAQGDRVSYEVEYCTKKSQSFVVKRQLLNTTTGELWDVPDRLNFLSTGCLKEVHDFITPLRADSGTYKMIAEVTLKINPIRAETYHFETEKFEIK